MAKINPVRESLRISQDKMASLLGVSRSHLAMYENGQRELPTKALITLSEMARYVIENPKDLAKVSENKKLNAAIRESLKRQITETTYLQLKLEKKIAATKMKLEDAAAQLQLSGFSKARAKNGKALPEPPVNLITGEAVRTLESKLSFELYQDELKLRRLAFDLQLFQEELKKHAAV